MVANKRTAKTVFSIKEVLMVGGAMLTAIGPLIANDMRLGTVQAELAARKEDIKIIREENVKIRSDIQTAIELAIANKASLDLVPPKEIELKQLETDITILKEKVNTLEHKNH